MQSLNKFTRRMDHIAFFRMLPTEYSPELIVPAQHDPILETLVKNKVFSRIFFVEISCFHISVLRPYPSTLLCGKSRPTPVLPHGSQKILRSEEHTSELQ